ncbi:MAG: double zinc ribbon domain-containing protein [Blastocatellia bacterium]
MNSPTDELLDLCADMDAEPLRPGFTGGLDLYDELIHFVAPSHPSEHATGNDSEHDAPAIQRGTTEQAPMSEPPAMIPAADTGPLSHSGDVIRITGALVGFSNSRAAMAAMIVCGDCGNHTDDGEMFCIHCGSLIEAVAASAEAALTLASLCDDCGTVIESDEIFCPSCGAVMATA